VLRASISSGRCLVDPSHKATRLERSSRALSSWPAAMAARAAPARLLKRFGADPRAASYCASATVGLSSSNTVQQLAAIQQGLAAAPQPAAVSRKASTWPAQS
jgi:methionyl-tRNA formyltransferase